MRVSSISVQFLLLQKSFFLSSAFLSSSSSNRHHEIISSNTFTSIAPNNLNKASSRTSLYQSSSSEESFAKAPTFNGQLTLPFKVISSGLSNTTPVAAVYAIQSNKPSRPNDASYASIKHIGYTKDLLKDLTALQETYGTQIAYVRALSFAYPQKAAMMEVANRWASMVHEQGGSLGLEEKVEERSKEEKEEKEELVRLMMETADYDDDDDDDDDDEFEFDDEDEAPAALFVDKTNAPKEVVEEEEPKEEDEKTSPFEMPTYASTSDSTLEFNLETVDKVLDEIRPYLISDGGNVSIHSVNEETRSVYLILEGACGSCASSTVTMQMGIERVLKENFDNLGEVAQVTPEEDGINGSENANELNMEAVMKEVNRIKPAITAMGGQVDIVSVDPLGVVEVKFRGANKVQQGLELALRDVKFVKHVKFVQ